MTEGVLGEVDGGSVLEQLGATLLGQNQRHGIEQDRRPTGELVHVVALEVPGTHEQLVYEDVGVPSGTGGRWVHPWQVPIERQADSRAAAAGSRVESDAGLAF
jgi:hypothetical protein